MYSAEIIKDQFYTWIGLTQLDISTGGMYLT